MATPITWKNVPGSSSSSVDEASQPYGILNSGLSSGIAQLSDVLKQYRTGEMAAAENALMAQLGQYTTPEQMAQAQASGAIAGAVNDRWVNAEDATRAIESRISGLQSQARSAQEYSDFTDAVASRPHMEAISRMGVLGDIAGIEAYVAENSDVRGLGDHANKVLNSIYDTQSAQASIANSRAQADLARMNVDAQQQRLLEEEQLNNILKEIHRESGISKVNRDLLNKTSQKLAEQFGEYAVFDDSGIFDLQASEANMQQAFMNNRRAYSEAHVNQAEHNRLAAGLNLSEQERIEREKQLREKSNNEMSLLDRQRRMMTGIPSLESPTARTIGEWQGTIPELIDPVSLDEETKKYYNHLMSIAGAGTDTAKNEAIRARAYDSDINPSVIEKAFNLANVSSVPYDPLGQDLEDQTTQEARLLATEDEILKGNQNEILKRLSTAVESNGLLKDDGKGQQKVVNEAAKLANTERTITGTDGEKITYFLPEEVLETVLRTMPTDWRYSKAKEFRRALANWEKVNMDRILKGAFTREEILKERNHRRRLEELRSRSSSE